MKCAISSSMIKKKRLCIRRSWIIGQPINEPGQPSSCSWPSPKVPGEGCSGVRLMLDPKERVATPTQMCCNNLLQRYKQRPTCICPLLNDTSLTYSFPINTTLALQLPLLCNLRIDPSTCPGTSGSALSPPAQVSFGATPKSS